MEDTGKRLLLAVALALGIMAVWQLVFAPDEQPEKAQKAPDPMAPPPGAPALAPPPGVAPGTAAEAAAPVVEVARGPEQEIHLELPQLDVVFSSWGGAVKSWRLTEPKYKRMQTGGELVLTSDPDHYPFQVNFAGSTVVIPPRAEWQGTKVSDTVVKYVWSSKDLRVEKTFTIHPTLFLVKLEVDVAKLTAEPPVAKQSIALSLFSYQDPKAEVGGGMGRVRRDMQAACDVDGEVSSTTAASLVKGPRERTELLSWGGFVHPYFLFASAPKRADGEQIGCNAYAMPDQLGVMRVDLVFPLVALTKDEAPLHREVISYFGPKFLDRLDSASTVAGFEPHFGDSVDLGWFSIIARPLLWLLQWFQSFVGNWGIAIILLTCLVKLATLYWTTKSMRSMKAMASLRPQIEEIQKRFPDDRQRQQQEMMALYKVNGVNPLAGCLPMLLQMPIWIALYRMLSTAGELYQAQFIPGWIEDMTASDPYYILPFVLLVMMFVQARLSPAQGDSTQQKMMMYGLPLVFGVLSFFFPAGLTIYILTNTTLTSLHTLYMNKYSSPVKTAASMAPGNDKAGKPAAKATAATATAAADDDDGDEGDDDANEEPSTPATAKGRPGGRPQAQRKTKRRRK